MRIALVVHGFPPHERTGVENYTAGLAGALARAGHRVEVFAPRRAPELPEHSLRREERGDHAVTWITLGLDPEGPREMLDRPGVTRAFGRFLDAERPDVVHVQHVVKLGLGPILAASERGIPVVYTAHDYYAVCHRYTLLRPDLEHCDVRGDSMACARCDAALGYLNAIPALGDYQMGALPEQLDESQRAGLAGLLADDPEPAGWDPGVLDAACDLRRELDSLRLRAFNRVDRFLAPTRFLAEELARGGLARERIQVLSYGVETGDLRPLPPAAPAPGAPVRFGFFGGLSKHKGVHVLLEAFERLDAPAELTVHGYSSDAPYVALLRERAARAGAAWGGPYERADLPALLARTDVVVVPSTWVENQPLVVLEAFAAHRAVIASAFGALPEGVRDGVDGLLFPVGDAEALAAAMRRCATEEGLVARLAGAAPPVKSSDAQAAELGPLYEELVAAAAAAGPDAEADLPASVRPFAGRVRALGALPTRELIGRVLAGLGRLREGLGPELPASSPEALLERALASGGELRARALLRDARLEAAWREERLRSQAVATSSVATERDWLREILEAKDVELEWLRGEVESLRELVKTRDEELESLHMRRAELELLVREVRELEGRILDDGAAIEALEERFTHIRATLEEHARSGFYGAQLPTFVLEMHDQLAQRELRPLLARLAGLTEEVEDLPPSAPLHARLRVAAELADRLLDELARRRGAMAEARRRAERRLVRLLVARTGLGREVLAWDADGEGGTR